RTPKPVLPVFLSVICTLRHGAPQEQPLPTSSSMMRAIRPAHDEALSLPVSWYTVFAIRSAPITIASRISLAPHGHAQDAAPARWASDERYFRYASMHSATMRHASLCGIQLSPSPSRQKPSAMPMATHTASSRELPT